VLQTWLSGLFALSFTVGLNSARSAFKAWPQRLLKTTNVSAHTDVQWCSTRSQAQPNRRKGLTHESMHDQCTNASTKARGSQWTYLSASITFSTCITAYKKQEAPNRHTSLFLLLSSHTSLRTKSMGLPIDVPLYIYYFSYVASATHKKQGTPQVCAPSLLLD
jgi:hypothetical protein